MLVIAVTCSFTGAKRTENRRKLVEAIRVGGVQRVTSQPIGMYT